MAHRHADESCASSSVDIGVGAAGEDGVDDNLGESSSASAAAATFTSHNNSNSSGSGDDVIFVAGDDLLTIDLTNTSGVDSTAASSSSSSSNANKNATVVTLITREASESVVIASSSTAAAAAAGSDTSAAVSVLECPICLQTCIHPARLPCGHIFCFLCVKGVAYKNRRCAMCRREIPPEFLDHPQLVNGIDDICTTKATDDGYQWFYEGRNGWWQYDDRTSQDIEDAYRKGEKSCSILVAGYVYIVDLEAMLQQRQNEPTRCRHVKRDLATIPKKGVAGLRIEGNTVTTDSNFASQFRDQNQQRQQRGGGRVTGADDDDDYILRRRLLPSASGAASASDFISTIAATDAAIRIASDIIGSTLAHADELSRGAAAISSSTLTPSSVALTTNTSGEQYLNSSSSSSANARGSRELLGAAEDLLDATQNIISAADQQTIDLFEQTLNDFHALTLRNIIDSSEEEDGGELVNDGGSGNTTSNASAMGGNGNGHRNRQMRF